MLHILLDTDIGNDMDDMQALAYLLAQPGAELLGITTVTGEAIARAELADMMLRLAGRGDVPVHVGSENPLSGAFLRGTLRPLKRRCWTTSRITPILTRIRRPTFCAARSRRIRTRSRCAA